MNCRMRIVDFQKRPVGNFLGDLPLFYFENLQTQKSETLGKEIAAIVLQSYVRNFKLGDVFTPCV